MARHAKLDLDEISIGNNYVWRFDYLKKHSSFGCRGRLELKDCDENSIIVCERDELDPRDIFDQNYPQEDRFDQPGRNYLRITIHPIHGYLLLEEREIIFLD